MGEDVGWSTWEELDVARGPANFGWPLYEGLQPANNYYNTNTANLADCANSRDAMLAEIAQLAKSGRVLAIVLSSRWPDANVPGTLPGPLAEVRSGFAAGLARLNRIAGENNVRLVLVEDTPLFLHHVPRCLARRADDHCAVSRTLAERDHGDARQAIAALAAHNSRIRILDPSRWLCATGSCTPMRDGIVLFADDHHLSSVGSAGLAAPLRPMLDAAILGP